MHKLILVAVLFSLSFFLEGYVHAQDNGKSGVIRVRKIKDSDPHIAGKKGGDITAAELCNSQGIVSLIDGVKIIYFEMTYFRGGEVTKEVNGNAIPPEACSYLATAQSGLMITFENIMGQDARGVKFRMNPMRFKLVKTTSVQPSNSAMENIQPMIDLNGMYELQDTRNGLEKTFIKLYNDSVVFYLNSSDLPVIVSQRLEREYKSNGQSQGKYIVKDGKLFIDLNNSLFRFDLEGSYNGSGLRLKQKLSNGALAGDEMRFSILPFSK